VTSEGHELSRKQIAGHGRDRYPTAAEQYAKVADELGELGAALIQHAENPDPDRAQAIREEYADTGLALYALGDKMGLDLIECMRELVSGDMRDFR
jgi:hypothetical protein